MIRVLVVDDDFMVARLHSAWVQRTPDFAVVGVAHTAAQALSMVDELHPDLLLLDVYLPDRTGLQVTAELRSRGDGVDILIVTAARDMPTVQQAIRGGAVSYLIKPFEREALTERLAQYADRRERLAAHPATQADVDAHFPGSPGASTGAPLPKGVTRETVQLVTSVLRQCQADLSAADCALATGLSRVSARRYLEHLTGIGQASVTLRYGTAGRPQRRYAWSGGP